MEKGILQSYVELSSKRFVDEAVRVDYLAEKVRLSRKNQAAIIFRAKSYIENIRKNPSPFGIEAFFGQYGLDTDEGLALMSLSEALLRIPDTPTANALIHDKLQNAKWNSKKDSSGFLNASSAALKLASSMFKGGALTSKIVDPVVRASIKKSMQILGRGFVMGENIKKAMSHATKYEQQKYLISYDVLGEGARTNRQAEAYLQKYIHTIDSIKQTVKLSQDIFDKPGVSVKLSALYPRYELTNKTDVMDILLPRLKTIVASAAIARIPIVIDAEENTRLDLSLELLSQIIEDEAFFEFQGIGLAVQAYNKNALDVIDYIISLAKKHHRKIPIRLVKGAYWDYEIKQAQIHGLENYPVFTHKSHTDISYLACAYKMLENNDLIYPQFATHNAMTIAEILEAADGKEFELQLLHGMGKSIYDQIVGRHKCRVYAPVGEYKDLLSYLIRRLLENSANTSFVQQLSDPAIKPDDLLKDPLESIRPKDSGNKIPLPKNIYSTRKNSSGCDLGNLSELTKLRTQLDKFNDKKHTAAPIIGGKDINGAGRMVFAPYDSGKNIGSIIEPTSAEIKEAMNVTAAAFEKWSKTPVEKRAAVLNKLADLLEENIVEAISICSKEAGKTIRDSIAEVREAADFCRYYANEATCLMSGDIKLKGYTGEDNSLSLHGRGVFMCISPWNFPLAIFLGQVSAALVTGNTVIAKPAEQTPMIAYFAVKLLLKAGLPSGAIALLPGNGEVIGKYLLGDNNLAGVVFTGSVATARKINFELANRVGAIIPFIAETGGQNAMIVDNSALIEQTVDDIITSAFGSVGQRCSALRVLYVTNDIADELITTLAGAMDNLKIGNPSHFMVDLGPVIDKQALEILRAHIKDMTIYYKLAACCSMDNQYSANGNFIEPHVFEINSITDLSHEVFGPILHVVRYDYENIDQVISDINSCGYGLTLGIQTRIASRAEYIRQRVRVGNCYVNRSMIGAVVGVQPFGGEGLSGTGPKAGGPHYLTRFVTERTYTVNTTAIGGNRELLATS